MSLISVSIHEFCTYQLHSDATLFSTRIFVVQQVLMFKNNEATRKICDRIKMQYIYLAQRKDGSHVVEKCIRASEYGMKSVVESLLSSEMALLQLACHQLGNYVIQTALKTAKVN